MNADDFEKYGTEMVKYIADYMRTLPERRVTSDVEPGYMRGLLPEHAPTKGENFREIIKDVERIIMPGLTQWQHPQFHTYFPTGTSYPSILGDMLSGAISGVCFSWAANPASTELEVVVLDWIGKLINLPSDFLHEGGRGGGVIQGSASECVLVTLLASRFAVMEKTKTHPHIDNGYPLSKLVAYSSNLANSCVEKAGMVGLVKMRLLDVDENYALRGYTLANAIEEDRRMGLIPFYVCATLGTTGCCSHDNIEELGEVCAKEHVWLHVDAAYAGNALICPEFQHLLKGVENVSSISISPNKWMLVNLDCSVLWVRDRKALTSALTVDPIYLKHEHDGPNALTQRLLKNINDSRRMHMIPALINENYVIRFAVCSATDDDIKFAWREISNAVEDLTSSKLETKKARIV